jgi:hypothetical protein
MLTVNASALPRIVQCVGSVALAKQAPKPAEHDASEEGIAAHWLAARWFNHPQHADKPGIKASNGWICGEEMFEHIAEYVRRFDNNLPRRVEAPAHWRNSTETFEVRGKADLTVWHPEQRTLAITDLKYGFRYVDPEMNWQLIAYAIGTAMALNVTPDKFILAIYQPRGPGEPLRSWEATSEQILTAYHELCAHLERAAAGADDLQTGEHCRYCPAAPGCPAAQRAGFNAVDVAMNSGDFHLDEAGMRAELDLFDRAEELLKQRRRWIEGYAADAIKRGGSIPGLSVKTTLGHTAWRPNVTVQDLREVGNNYIEEKPVTPAEAKRRGMSQEQYDKLTHRPVTGQKVVRKDAAEQAAKVFE